MIFAVVSPITTQVKVSAPRRIVRGVCALVRPSPASPFKGTGPAAQFDFTIDNQTSIPPTGGVKFEWDTAKAAANLAKHGIAFEEALVVFADPSRMEEEDTRKHYGETRINTTGMMGTLLVVTITHTSRNGVTRLISARPASRKERKKYHHG